MSHNDDVHSDGSSYLSDSTSSSVSTNYTASNLPGPGRTLGRFYDHAGRILEAQLNKVVAKRFRRSPGIQYGNNQNTAGPSTYGDATIRTWSTNFTAPNLPGAGRTLGILYDYAGNILEVRAGRFIASHARVGPDAFMEKIRLQVDEIRRNLDEDDRCDGKAWDIVSRKRSFIKKCKRLLKYAR